MPRSNISKLPRVALTERVLQANTAVQVYGTTLKALVHEQCGDGIMSAINFKLDIKQVDDPGRRNSSCDYPGWKIPSL